MRAEATSQTLQRYKAACKLAIAWNTGWSPMKVSKLVRRFEYQVEGNGHTLFDYLATQAAITEQQRVWAANDPDNLILLAYNDNQTGERAVRNVMRDRGW